MNPSRLFFASCLALVVTAMSFAIRGDIMEALELQFGLNKADSGMIASTAFWGFTIAMVIGGPLCDLLGMGRLIWLALIGHVAGVLITICASGFWSLFVGTLCIGIANGMVEAGCNPLVATLYPEDKSTKLNQFHVWFPGGIVIGGLLCYFFDKVGWGWPSKMALMLVPAFVYAALFYKQSIPNTERVQAGVRTGAMYKECVSRPLFLFMVCCMLLTAATELGPCQWIPNILQKSAGVSGILVLVWIYGLMALGRQFAGPVVHRLSPSGMLLVSAIFSAVGLFWLGYASNAVTTFSAATVFAIGVCYFWPTMLGFVAERCPRTGAAGLAIMGGAGMLSAGIIVPVIGRIYDANIALAGPGQGAALTLRSVAILPVILIATFSAIWISDRKRGGYQAEKL